MNARIKLLAEQAGATILTTHGMEHVVDGCYIIGPARLEKFAELIVQECAGLFPNVYVEIETDYGHTPVIASDYIKEHFGVEK
jgi:hypothetical protein